MLAREILADTYHVFLRNSDAILRLCQFLRVAVSGFPESIKPLQSGATMTIADTRIYPINTGWLEADLGTYVFGKARQEKKSGTVYCFYVDTGEYKILIDTGLCDEARATKYHHKCQKRGCQEVHRHLPEKLGIAPEEIDIVIFTHLHWDHVQNMKEFPRARFICPEIEIKWAYNPLPLYYRTYESPVLGIEPAYYGCNFELVHGETEIVPESRCSKRPAIRRATWP